jgi:ribosomal protein S18 acetylase RimI-like enzyme
MFVDSTFRGHKIGFSLGAAILDEARKRNYSSMRLSTGPRHYAALGLYQSLGFTVVDEEMSALNMPNGLPEDLAAGVIEMELKL